ncbi:hypothetical protein GALL_348120 [mine drainage metagenome]|jgi:uncharacterized ferritin-like protein (DUF455 family)|uniref:Ferritin-like domain-containing protein n=1 Tax=mine drainage metagenome TaxID=410659 RepID=A0A1J5QU50_9ZZZZ
MPSLREQALHVVQCADVDAKLAAAHALAAAAAAGAEAGAPLHLAEPGALPGRPPRPRLRPHRELQQGSLATAAGRAALVHALAHIEFNAIDLACDAVWRFAAMPDAFYRDWAAIAAEEATHFALLREHLRGLGYDYGAFDAHGALWEMAERTRDDLLARIALVPRTLEARGLDASPAVRAKLVGAGDVAAGAILDVILRDEIGHVAAGNRWYRWLCTQRGLDPLATYAGLVERYAAPRARGPFNVAARRAAGFTEDELQALQAG